MTDEDRESKEIRDAMMAGFGFIIVYQSANYWHLEGAAITFVLGTAVMLLGILRLSGGWSP